MNPDLRCAVSIFSIEMWTVKPAKVKEHDSEAMPRIMLHLKEVHPLVLSSRSLTSAKAPNRMLMREYSSFKNMGRSDSAEMTSECRDLWGWRQNLMMPGSFKSMIWEAVKPKGYSKVKDAIPLPFRNPTPSPKSHWI